MSEPQVDLFGFTTSGLSFKEQQQVNATSRKAPVRLQIDRKALWSQNSYGFGGIRELDDDEDLAEAASTSDTKADNMTIERLEVSIGLAPVIKNGKWVQDELGYTYRRVGKGFKGDRQLGARGSMVRDLNKQNVLTMARRAMEPLFNDPCCWIILNSIGLLATRLNMMDEDEDPYACLAAFLEVMCQHDFIDNQRSGDTIRSITRRENERDRRRNKKAQREASKGAQRSKRPQDDEDDGDLDDDSND
jgi:hypothetical protein